MGRDRGKWQRKKEGGGGNEEGKISKRLGQGGSEREKKGRK